MEIEYIYAKIEESYTEIDQCEDIELFVDYNEYIKTETAKDIFLTRFGKNESLSQEDKLLVCSLLNLKYK